MFNYTTLFYHIKSMASIDLLYDNALENGIKFLYHFSIGIQVFSELHMK